MPEKIRFWAFYKSKQFQLLVDICRVLLFIMAVLIFYKLVTEIEAVKVLMYDPCEICMNKTGAICMFEYQINPTPIKQKQGINWTEALKDINISES